MSVAANDDVLVVRNVSKRYEIYERPADRLKQFILPRLDATLSRKPRSFFKEFWALRDISLSVRKGEAVGILGRNGAGKSTLLQIVAGTLAPTQGESRVQGRVAALLELGSGFSPEFTGSENVRLNAALLGLSAEQIDAAYDRIVAFADIGDFINQPVKIYSSGMMLRLAFAVQTAVEPDLLIVDEALAVGDARFQKKCFDRLERLTSGGTTLLLVTHDANTVVRACSRAVILEGGHLIEDGVPQGVTRSYHRLLFDAPKAEPGSLQAAEGESAIARAEVPAGPANEHSDLAVAAPVSSVFDGRDKEARETRYGSKDAEISEIGIRDLAGRTTTLIEIHHEYEFFFRVRFRRPIGNPVAYGLMISTAKGVEVFATKAALHGRRLPASSAGTLYECRYRCSVPLVPGTYFLSASIAHDDGRESGEFLDFRFDALQFEVAGATRCFTTCLLELPGSLLHERLESMEVKSAELGTYQAGRKRLTPDMTATNKHLKRLELDAGSLPTVMERSRGQ